MFRLGADLKVYPHRAPIDFRAGINSLAVLVQETMTLDPFAPAVFAFCSRGALGPIAVAWIATNRSCCSIIAWSRPDLPAGLPIVMSDGNSEWRTLTSATHIGCMAHSRRPFVDALKARKKGGGPPEQALKFFEQLYRVERQARDERPDDSETQADCIRRFRQQHSFPS